MRWVNISLETAIREFAEGNKVQCRISDLAWTFDFTKNDATITLNKRMISFGEWYVEKDI